MVHVRETLITFRLSLPPSTNLLCGGREPPACSLTVKFRSIGSLFIQKDSTFKQHARDNVSIEIILVLSLHCVCVLVSDLLFRL